MRVVQVIETLRTGGAETSVIAIAEATPGVETTIVPLWGPVEVRSHHPAVRVTAPLDPSGHHGVPWLAERLRRILNASDVDLAHSTLFYANVASRLALTGAAKPLVTTVVGDSYGPLRRHGLSPGRLAKLAMVQFLDGVTAGRTDHFILISNALRESCVAALGLDPAKCTVIHRGRALERFERRSPPEVGPALLCVGRLIESKRVDVAIRALRELKLSAPAATLTIAGDGPLRSSLTRLADELGVADSVRFLGTRSDVPELMSQAHIFVFPSAHEGQGGALVEAMAAALPIIASRIPVVGESVADGDTAVLVDVGDARGLAIACLDIWSRSDRGSAMGGRARETARARFDVREIGKAHATLYRRILGERSR
jgi:glycosyltransferase involved in cell wall biosynthesis